MFSPNPCPLLTDWPGRVPVGERDLASGAGPIDRGHQLDADGRSSSRDVSAVPSRSLLSPELVGPKTTGHLGRDNGDKLYQGV